MTTENSQQKAIEKINRTKVGSLKILMMINPQKDKKENTKCITNMGNKQKYITVGICYKH